MTESQLESEVEEIEDHDPRPYVLANLGLDEDFLAASEEDKAELLDALDGAQVRKILFRALLYALLVTVFALQLRGGILLVGCGGLAMFAGRDLARFKIQRKLVAAARGLFLSEGLES